jgi:hypothetical protein
VPQYVTAVLPSPLRINASSPPRGLPYTVECVAVERPAVQGCEHQLAGNRLAVRRTPRQRDLDRRVLAHMLGQDGDNRVCHWHHWSGELRLWDNEILMGWYAANDGSIRSKGTMYFALHPHGLHMSGRWVGLGYDDRIMSGWASMGQTREESEKTMAKLIESEGLPPADD